MYHLIFVIKYAATTALFVVIRRCKMAKANILIVGRWFCKEDMSLRAANGRAMLHGRIWSSDGRQIATITQDGMIRYTKKAHATTEEIRTIRDRKAKWPPKGRL
jgi:hypothetical protein